MVLQQTNRSGFMDRNVPGLQGFLALIIKPCLSCLWILVAHLIGQIGEGEIVLCLLTNVETNDTTSVTLKIGQALRNAKLNTSSRSVEGHV